MSLQDKINAAKAAREARPEALRVSADTELFVTPPDVAERMVEALDLESFHTVLEPSAGTGNLVAAAREAHPTAWIVAFEREPNLCDMLRDMPRMHNNVVTWDFLKVEPSHIGLDLPSYFDRVVMNPPFKNGAAIRHVLHAREFLARSGVLVALVPDGPREAEAFKDWDDIERLPSGTFANTTARTRIVRWRS